MEVSRIDDMSSAEAVRWRGAEKRCLFFKEEICTAPKMRFQICRNCCRIDPRLAAKHLFEMIKAMAAQMLNRPTTGPGPVLPSK